MALIGRVVGSRIGARLLRGERGATAVEYAVMVALIAGVIILAVNFLGRSTSSTFSCADVAISARTSAC